MQLPKTENTFGPFQIISTSKTDMMFVHKENYLTFRFDSAKPIPFRRLNRYELVLTQMFEQLFQCAELVELDSIVDAEYLQPQIRQFNQAYNRIESFINSV